MQHGLAGHRRDHQFAQQAINFITGVLTETVIAPVSTVTVTSYATLVAAPPPCVGDGGNECYTRTVLLALGIFLLVLAVLFYMLPFDIVIQSPPPTPEQQYQRAMISPHMYINYEVDPVPPEVRAQARAEARRRGVPYIP